MPVKKAKSDKKEDKTKKISSVLKTNALSVPIYSLAGISAGILELPKEVFGVKVNSKLLAQALRVYLNNKKGHRASTKTRGEVKGSTRKIYSQKGTGRARHGAITAPIFVGGGVAFGPKYRKTILDLPKKMKKMSLISALSSKVKDGGILGFSGIEKMSGKTKELVGFVSKIKSHVLKDNEKLNKKSQNFSTLIVGDKNYDGMLRAVRNIEGVDFLSADQINAFEVIRHQSLILTREAVEKLQERLLKKETKESKVQEQPEEMVVEKKAVASKRKVKK